MVLDGSRQRERFITTAISSMRSAHESLAKRLKDNLLRIRPAVRP
jgi:hypothetical protein